VSQTLWEVGERGCFPIHALPNVGFAEFDRSVGAPKSVNLEEFYF